MSFNKRFSIVSLLFFLSVVITGWQNAFAQNVVISEYMNYTTAIGLNAQYNEWTELLVVGDNVDLRNYSIRDNNNGQTGWQPQVNFNNIPFWQHMRAGTIIVLRHRCTNVGGTPYSLDVDPSDGYLELCLEDTFYFSGGDFGAILNATMNIASDGDIIQLRNSSGNHVHALSHKSTPDSSWTGMSCPKINHASGLLNGESVQISPGSTLNDYGIGGSCISGVAYTNVSTASSLGLANNGTTNKNFWRFVREPSFSPASIFPSAVLAGLPGSISFNWTAAIDPYPADGVVKYLILRNTIPFFGTPVDGTSYAVGQAMGFGSAVISIINNSTITTFTDNTVLNGQQYYYKIYAYKYSQDNINGNTYANERGSAYGTPSVTVNWPYTTPLPIELISFDGTAFENEVLLSWATASEIDNDYFIMERSKDGSSFEAIGWVDGAGSSSQILNYTFTDIKPFNEINYYRLKQTDYNGEFSYSETITMNFQNKDNSLIQSVYPNPVSNIIYVTLSKLSNENVLLKIVDVTGAIRKEKQLNYKLDPTYQINLSELSKGIYFLIAESNSIVQTQKIILIH